MAPYSRTAAVSYALTYALHPNPFYRYFPIVNDNGGDCANFLSQCLYAGGLMMDNVWWYKHSVNNNTRYDRWSMAWAVAHVLYWRLKRMEITTNRKITIGDAVFFEDKNGKIFHSALITSVAGGNVLISHHSFEARNIPISASWHGQKVHFIKIN